MGKSNEVPSDYRQINWVERKMTAEELDVKTKARKDSLENPPKYPKVWILLALLLV